MTLSPTAHVDTFARDHLPAPELWPTLEFTTESLQYPQHLNAAVGQELDGALHQLRFDRNH